MASFETEILEQTEAAARRVAGRSTEREHNKQIVAEPGGLARADSPERVAKRIDRLSRHLAGEALPDAPAQNAQAEATPDTVVAEALERCVVAGTAPPGTVDAVGAVLVEDSLPEPSETGKVLEKIILTPDFMAVRYLDAGVASARAVCRIEVPADSGGVEYGTGSLVSSRLILTNHHVLPDAQAAARATAQFDYQDDVAGRPRPVRAFALDPQTFFLADRTHDFALVAVRAAPGELDAFGSNRLIEAEGKAIIGENVTIVQHPRGEKKQVVLRENQIVDMADDSPFMHYETDTQPGSSGSPVFNDQWEVVALHHAATPAPERADLGGWVNEGVRISRILRFVGRAQLPAAQRALADELVRPGETTVSRPDPPPERREPATRVEVPAATQADGVVRITIPLEISIRIGEPLAGPQAAPAPGGPEEVLYEKVEIDPDYRSRRGYDPEFLGKGAKAVPYPTLPDELMAGVCTPSEPTHGHPDHVLTYHHYSVVMNRERRLAFFTAVNIDGKLVVRFDRETDKWSYDPRIPESEQTGEAAYEDNPLDRGHLVRRIDPSWSKSRAFAKVCQDDTFHFTNCAPQHSTFNQRQSHWAGLEDYVLKNAETHDMKVTVFSGPVFDATDEEFQGVQLPRQYWKVVVIAKTGSGKLSATGYLLSQEKLIANLESLEAFEYGAYKTFQVPVRKIEALTRIRFGGLRDHDPLEQQESLSTGREIAGPQDLTL